MGDSLLQQPLQLLLVQPRTSRAGAGRKPINSLPSALCPPPHNTTPPHGLTAHKHMCVNSKYEYNNYNNEYNNNNNNELLAWR